MSFFQKGRRPNSAEGILPNSFLSASGVRLSIWIPFKNYPDDFNHPYCWNQGIEY
ncbi:unnamed protein product [Rhodiola kirilowii]